jgi:hypothetical protein
MTMALEAEWARLIGPELERRSRGRGGPSIPQVRLPNEADAVFLNCRYENHPVLGELAWDLEQLDLAVRRAALATERGVPAERFASSKARIPRRLGLQLRGSSAGSLELLLDIPTWIVAALASQPATALANAIALLSAREALRVRIREARVMPRERPVLDANARPPVQVREPSNSGASPDTTERILESVVGASTTSSSTTARQGALPREVKDRLTATPAEFVLDVGNIHVRTQGLAVDVTIQEGDRLTSVSVTPKRQP